MARDVTLADLPPPADDDGKIYCQYFDEKGNGPTALEVAVDDFATLNAEIDHPIFGFGFKLADDFDVNNAPIGGGISLYRESVVKLHAAMGEWLAKHPEAK